MNPDDYIEGTFDNLNPVNWDDQLEPFESNNIQESYFYGLESKDFEPLENAITYQETVIETVLSELDFLIDAHAHSDNVLLQNKLRQVKSKLKSTQIKRYEI
jgi:hypothetical protein